ncbi:hypothetical protein BDEG_23931 [Batrachochytrium dendrobatidis JEL423]|uniref:Uncharacterized protein n=1 Tax=Batrachochytrium dendrobatidis (strain JEL423) TaxID=403673 RepID=A0A177WJ65_BATDL|nr:hypothetical protein BDEG_23931 [Batrachochytrium dendrobatidis JEL423]
MYGSSSSQKHVRSLKDMDNNRNKDTDTLQSSSHPHLSATSPIPLSRELLGQFQVAKVFKDNSRHITSIDFDADGYSCVTASEDESIRIYDVRSGKSRNCIYSKKYGCALARFTHRSTNIIYASTKEDDALRYMSLHDNKYLRYYKGHKKRVVSLVMSPQDDSVLSASLDDTVRFWDLRSPNCQGLMHTDGGQPCLAFDQGGFIFAVGLGSCKILLYDIKEYNKGPFATFPIKDPITLDFAAEWTHMSFSNDGKLILISTTSNVMYIVDAFNGGIKHRLTGHMNQMGMAFEACFTPDAEFVIGGSQDGKIHYWEVETGKHIHALEWHHEPPKVVAFNPKHLMFASADTNLAFWIPSM